MTEKPAGPTSPKSVGTSSSCLEPTGTPRAELPAVLRNTGRDTQWIGDGELWVEVSWTRRDAAARRPDGGFGFKFATVTIVDGRLSRRAGAPVIEVRSLEGTEEGSGSFGGYATSGSGALRHWWPTGIEIPASGCWVVTEKSAGSVVRFHVRVP